jgi:quercetin dioxygenase-like cupin family protein
LNIWVFCGLISQSIGCRLFTQDRGGYAKDFVSPIDEIDFFLDGSLIYAHEGKSFTARKGDVVFFEKGEKISFVTDESCSVFFVTFPLMMETVEALKKGKEQQEQTG